MNKWKFSLYIITMLIGVLGFVAHTYAGGGPSFVGYYFCDTTQDHSPATLANYADDADCTIPSASIPYDTVDPIRVVSGATYQGDITLSGAGSANQGTIDGNAVFNGNSTNTGTVTVNAIFNATSSNSGTVNGDAIFNGSSTNGNSIQGNAVFNGNSENEGTIQGDATFFSTFYHYLPPLNGDFIVSSQYNGEILGTIYGADMQPITKFIFISEATNEGTIHQDTVFLGDASQNFGTILGTKIRQYDHPYAPDRDFVTSGPWTIVANGVTVNLVDTIYGGTTTLSAINGGSFVTSKLYFAYFNDNTIGLVYKNPLDSTPLPSPDDYTVTVNGQPVSVLNVAIQGSEVALSLPDSSSYNSGDTITVSYSPGSNPLQEGGSDVGGFTNKNVQFLIPVTPAASYLFGEGKKVYASSPDPAIDIIDTSMNTITASLSTSGAYSAIGVGNRLYAIGYPNNTVDVFDTNTNTLLTTVDVGGTNGVAVGPVIYICDYINNTVHALDTQTDTVVADIPVGGNPYEATVVGHKVYVDNTDGNAGNTVSVIDTDSNTVINTITVGGVPRYPTPVGKKVYTMNTTSANVSVIDTETDTVIATIAVGNGPRYASLVGTKLYVLNRGSDSVSVINTFSNTVLQTIHLDGAPIYSNVIGNKLYISTEDNSAMVVVDTLSDTVEDTVYLDANPMKQAFYVFSINGFVYTSAFSHFLSAIDITTIPSLVPNLTSFSTTSPSGTYHTGDSIPITAHFGRTLQAGSTMTLKLSTGDAVTLVLDQVSGNTLTGTYVIGGGDVTPDLFVRAIVSANVSDTFGHTRTNYDLPSSQGDFEGENSFITRNLGDNKNIAIGIAADTIDVGSHPYQVSQLVGNSIYVANQGSNTVSVIDATTGDVTNTISVGGEPYGLAYTNGKLFVANVLTNNVSVINTTTNAVVATIPVGVKPYYVATIGNNVYVTNGASNTVSVINSNTNTVTATVPVGSYPRGIKAHGTDLYVANYGDPNYSGGNYISVIDSTTNTVTHAIISPAGSDGPRGVNVLGNKVYVANFRSDNVSVIDTTTSTIVDTIDVGKGPRGIAGVGTTLYVENFEDSTISVIDTTTDTVTKTVDVGSSPSGISIINGKAYITSFQDNKVYKLNTVSNELDTVSMSDTTAPDTTLTPLFSDPTTDTTGSFTIASNESGTFECSLDSGTYTACVSPYTTPTLSVGAHSLSVRAIDTALNVDPTPATFSWTITAVSSGGGSSGGGGSSHHISGGGSYSYTPPPMTIPSPVVVCPQGDVFSALTGQRCTAFNVQTPPVSTSTSGSIASPYIFLRTLSWKMTGTDVLQLQHYLNTHGSPVAPAGVGSLGHETAYFGLATKAAVGKFQLAHGITPPAGLFGPITRAYVNSHH